MKRLLWLVVASAWAAASAPCIQAADPKPAAPAVKPGLAEPQPASKARRLPFRGKVKAADPQARTFTVGKSVFHVSAETKLQKAGQPAVFGDLRVGEEVSGSYALLADGKRQAFLVNIGPKTDKPKPKSETPSPARQP